MKRKNKVSKDELSAKQIKELKKFLNLSPMFHVLGKVDDFFDYYLLCEVTARKLIFFQTGKTSQTLYTKSINSAVKHYFPNQYNILRHPLTKSFLQVINQAEIINHVDT